MKKEARSANEEKAVIERQKEYASAAAAESAAGAWLQQNLSWDMTRMGLHTDFKDVASQLHAEGYTVKSKKVIHG